MTEEDVRQVTEVAKNILKERKDMYSEHILAYISFLEKENAELKESIKNYVEGYEYLISTYKAQIEKMKSCNNCKHRMFDYPFCTEKTVIYLRNPYKEIGIKSFCENMNKWELAE